MVATEFGNQGRKTQGLEQQINRATKDPLKYATRYNPTQSDTLARLNGVFATHNTFALLFRHSPGAGDLKLFVEHESALVNVAAWIGIATNAGGTGWNPTNATETGIGSPLTVIIQDNVVPAGNRFYRLRVTSP